ncbi:hypothetical protein FB106_12715 [Synechococcus sp. Ace-Pa]|nr:hypothetical protein FB106_12715 [Synechococcus sp. Ace-Pa]
MKSIDIRGVRCEHLTISQLGRIDVAPLMKSQSVSKGSDVTCRVVHVGPRSAKRMLKNLKVTGVIWKNLKVTGVNLCSLPCFVYQLPPSPFLARHLFWAV